MSSEWKSYQLSDLTKLKYGKFLAKSQLDESGFPVFSGYGIVGYLPTFQFEEPQLLIVCRGEGGTGDVKMSPPKCSITNLSIVFSPNEQIVSKRFLYWALKAGDTHRLRTGSAQAQIVIGSLERFGVAIPADKSEQDEIAYTLDALDTRITLLHETNATLEAIAQALFKSWFVDFDPVRAKAEGRQPDAAQGSASVAAGRMPEATGMGAATAVLFPDTFEDSELGPIPKGWGVGVLADLANLNPESWTAKNHPDVVSYVDLANAKDNLIAEISEYVFDEAPSRARRVLKSGDSIIGTVRPGNRSFAFIHFAEENLTGSTGFAVLRPRKEEHTEFVYLAATADSSIEYLTHVADGGAYPAVRPEVVSGLQCVLPSSSVLNAFHGLAAPIFVKVGENNMQAQTLSQLRDTLLPRLISGQLRLPEAQEHLEDALA